MSKKATLLVVEDEPNLLLGIRDILELDDYTVITAQNGKEALEVMNSLTQVPDLIVSDIMMPYMDGIQFLEEVRKNEKWVMIPFIFLTAKGSKSDVQHGKLMGVDDYLIKPFDADDLLVAVQARLKRHQVMRVVADSEVESVKRKVLTILNHEFRTPLTLVVAYADMLKNGNIDNMNDSEVLMFLKEINSGADRLRRLIENFILLVELESGDVVKTYEWRKSKIIDFETILHAVHTRIFSNPRISHTCDLQIKSPLPPIEGDREYLSILIYELIDNAIKFSPEQPQIIVQAEGVDKNLVLKVIDFGRGIPENEIENIWKPFYQINREYHEDQGSGSGLTIVEGLVKLHGASIDVQSTVGERTCFTVTFPSMS